MEEEVYQEVEEQMERAVDSFARELRSVRTGRANIAILDDVHVDYYGTSTPLNQIANLSAPESTLLLIQPYDKSTIPEIEKGILEADLGLNPQDDGNVVRIPIPELTEERRVELTKRVGKLAEGAKTSVRNARRTGNDLIKDLKSEGEISEDDEHRAYDRIQTLTDGNIERIEELAERKNQEILEF